MESGLVGALGVKIGGRALDSQPFETVRGAMLGREDAFEDSDPTPTRTRVPDWSPGAQERLARVPAFVRGMVKRIYSDYARERGIVEITPELMDRARSDLGLEGM
jgi:hypothetical protein